jgi:hypothetical protein
VIYLLISLNISGMNDVIHKAFTPNINVIQVTEVLDIKEWLLTEMESLWGNHSKPHHFMFKKNDGISEMFYK